MINETVLRDVLIVLAKQQKATSELISLLLTEVSSLGQSVNGVRPKEDQILQKMQLLPFQFNVMS